MASCPQNRTGGARSVQSSLPLPMGPFSAGMEGLPPLWGHREKSQRRLCFQETEARSRHDLLLLLLPGSVCRRQRVRVALPSQH